ncbi:MAG: ABC transporter permease subunit [Clostridia bacterium]|nr:ABC transporter permease subunit [Clostridia bacterium]
MKAIFKREMLSYFTSPIGYVFLGIFMLVSGSYYREALFVHKQGDMCLLLSSCMAMLMLLIPVITMRLLSEEKSSKTDQLLLTSPVKVWEIVIGKYLAAFSVFMLSVVTTLPYLLVAAKWGTVVWIEILPAYLGYILVGALLIAIGLFISAMTESQFVAAVITYGVIMAVQFITSVNTGNEILDAALKYLCLLDWSNEFYYSIISVSNVFYYLSFTAVFVFATVRKVESRRWK